MTSLLCVSFHASSNHNFVEMLSHLEHVNGFSPVCILSCICKFTVLIKALLHMEQANGFSPVLVLSCIVKLPLWLKAFSHLEQANGFSPNGQSKH